MQDDVLVIVDVQPIILDTYSKLIFFAGRVRNCDTTEHCVSKLWRVGGIGRHAGLRNQSLRALQVRLLCALPEKRIKWIEI